MMLKLAHSTTSLTISVTPRRPGFFWIHRLEAWPTKSGLDYPIPERRTAAHRSGRR
jgi:hypothetical protein